MGSRPKNAWAQRVRQWGRRLVRRAAQNERIRKFVYEFKNVDIFADMRQHDRMLADSVRCETYWDGLQKHIEAGDVVVDLGTGSGVLAFFASRAGARRVHAIEHGPLADAAEAVAADNGIANVELHRTHSRKLKLPAKVDVIVHEQIGEVLFNEQVVENVVDLRDRVLKPGGKILPAHLALFIEPVELSREGYLPYAWQQKLHGIDFAALKPFAEAQPQRYQFQTLEPFPFGQWLADRAPALVVDLHTATASSLPKEIAFQRTVITAGNLDGMAVFFDVGFDEELSFGNAPDAPVTSWAIPLLRTERTAVTPGQVIRFELRAGDLADPPTWDWTIDVSDGNGSSRRR
jgi:protein arginine N-methyltransferase 1